MPWTSNKNMRTTPPHGPDANVLGNNLGCKQQLAHISNNSFAKECTSEERDILWTKRMIYRRPCPQYRHCPMTGLASLAPPPHPVNPLCFQFGWGRNLFFAYSSPILRRFFVDGSLILNRFFLEFSADSSLVLRCFVAESSPMFP